MKQSEITQMSVEDLQDTIETSIEQLRKLMLNHKISYLENPLQIRNLRKTVARLKTELNKRESQN